MTSCSPSGSYQGFDFENKSDKSVVFMLDLEEIDGKWYASTEFNQDTLSNYRLVESMSSNSIYMPSEAFAFQSGDEMCIYVFDLEVLDNERWETIKQEKMYLKKFDLVFPGEFASELGILIYP